MKPSTAKPTDEVPDPVTGAEPLLPRVQERMLREWLKKRAKTAGESFLKGGERLLCNTLGRGQFAAQMAVEAPQALVTCHFFDLFSQQLVQQTLVTGPIGGPAPVFPPNLSLICQPDLPPEGIDCFAWFVSQRGEAELTRDALQMGHERLKVGGEFLAATDNPTDQWLHEQLRAMFDKVTRSPSAEGVVYRAVKLAPLKKLKDFACEFPTRSGTDWLYLRTRPGVFSHRHIDPGARALIQGFRGEHIAGEEFHAAEESKLIRPGMQVLDLGCGCGVVGLLAAREAENVQVVCADSSTRAIESVQWAITKNNLPQVKALLDCDGSSLASATFDLALINPPYFAHFRIAEHFVRTSHRALKPDGKLLIVTKTPQWYLDFLPEFFGEIQSWPVKNYVLVSGVKVDG